MDLSVMSEIIAQAVKNNAVVIEDPDEANPSFTERAKEYLKALEEKEEETERSCHANAAMFGPRSIYKLVK